MTATAATPVAPWLSDEVFDEIEQESVGNYIQPSKLEDGKEHRFRFVGLGISGFETWTTAKKPVRYRIKPSPNELPSDVKLVEGAPQIKRFIVTLVWDYQTESFRILTLTQKGMIGEINKFCKDEDYGDPRGYDVKITRTGSGMDTEYSILPAPPKPLAAAVQKALEKFHCNLEAHFDNGDPFAVE